MIGKLANAIHLQKQKTLRTKDRRKIQQVLTYIETINLLKDKQILI